MSTADTFSDEKVHLESRMRQLIGTTSEWATAGSTLVIGDGEIAIERASGGEIKMKIGNGTDTYDDLDYFSSSSTISGGGASFGAAQADKLYWKLAGGNRVTGDSDLLNSVITFDNPAGTPGSPLNSSAAIAATGGWQCLSTGKQMIWANADSNGARLVLNKMTGTTRELELFVDKSNNGHVVIHSNGAIGFYDVSSVDTGSQFFFQSNSSASLAARTSWFGTPAGLVGAGMNHIQLVINRADSTPTTTEDFIRTQNKGVTNFRIRSDGKIASTFPNIQAISDRRAKRDIADYDFDFEDALKKMKFKKFKMNDSNHQRYGLIADEVPDELADWVEPSGLGVNGDWVREDDPREELLALTPIDSTWHIMATLKNILERLDSLETT